MANGMDPNATLSELRGLAERISLTVNEGRPVDEGDSLRLAELALALDEWICRGGFLPADWGKA